MTLHTPHQVPRWAGLLVLGTAALIGTALLTAATFYVAFELGHLLAYMYAGDTANALYENTPECWAESKIGDC